MKRLLLTGLVLLGLGVSSAIAQGDDDIYYNSKDAKKDAEKYTEPARESRPNQDQNRYDDGSNRGGYYDNDNTISTDEGDEYSEYDSDDYSYTSSMRRFNSPMYGMGYYGGWYSPYWGNPYWGYTPGWSVGIGYGYGGFGGPYWSSGWGYNAWYGYPGWGSYWNSPYCGWGGGYYGYGGYGGGYWNGYYAGVYGTGRVVNYGSRYSLNGNRNGSIRRPSNAVSRTPASNNGGVRPSGLRTTNNNNGVTRGEAVRNNSVRGGVRSEATNASPRDNRFRADRPARGSFNSSEGRTVTGATQGTRPTRTYNNDGGRGTRVQNSGRAPRVNRQSGTPTQGNRMQNSGRSTPRVQSAPANSGGRSYSSPSSGSRGSSFGGSRSSGGGSRSSGGGGSRGGRR